jgi:hypothetical protein
MLEYVFIGILLSAAALVFLYSVLVYRIFKSLREKDPGRFAAHAPSAVVLFVVILVVYNLRMAGAITGTTTQMRTVPLIGSWLQAVERAEAGEDALRSDYLRLQGVYLSYIVVFVVAIAFIPMIV